MAGRALLLPMPSTVDITKLAVAERLALIDDLWASLAEDDVVLDAGQVNEAETRWQELKANPSLGVSLEQLKSRLG